MKRPKYGGLMPGQKAMTFWDALRKFPPFYVRLHAKIGRRTGLSDADIALASGIDIDRVREISRMRSWDNVTVRELLTFTTACNVDPLRAKDRARIAKYDCTWKTRNTTPFAFQRKNPKWEAEILPILQILRTELKNSSSNGSIPPLGSAALNLNGGFVRTHA